MKKIREFSSQVGRIWGALKNIEHFLVSGAFFAHEGRPRTLSKIVNTFIQKNEFSAELTFGEIAILI